MSGVLCACFLSAVCLIAVWRVPYILTVYITEWQAYSHFIRPELFLLQIFVPESRAKCNIFTKNLKIIRPLCVCSITRIYNYGLSKHNFSPPLRIKLCLDFVNNQLDAQLFLYMFISILYMFRAAMCPSSGELIVSIHLVYRLQSYLNLHTKRHLYRVTYTRCRIDTINSPDDGRMLARNM